MKFETKLLMVTALIFCAGLARNVTACPGISLPPASTGNTTSFGVALVYSLPILGLNAPSPGPISDCIVVTTDSNGALVGVNSAVMNDFYGYGGSPNSRPGDSSSTDAVNGDAAITWGTMMNALQAFLNNRPNLTNFGLSGNQTRTNAESQNGGAVTSDAAVTTGDAGPAAGGEAILQAASANAVVSPELSNLLDPANFDIAAVVPEPGTLVLFAMGLLALGLWRVTRRRNWRIR